MSETNTITLVLDLPGRLLSPNARRGGHWRHKRDAIKKYRQYAHYRALAKRSPDTFPWQKAEATAVFFWPDDSHERDIRNAEGSLKAAYDGIADAGIIIKDSSEHLTHGPTTFAEDRENPRVEVTIRRMA